LYVSDVIGSGRRLLYLPKKIKRPHEDCEWLNLRLSWIGLSQASPALADDWGTKRNIFYLLCIPPDTRSLSSVRCRDMEVRHWSGSFLWNFQLSDVSGATGMLSIHNVSRNPNLCIQYLDIFNISSDCIMCPIWAQVIPEEMVRVINSVYRRVHSILLAIHKSTATETEVRCRVLLKVIDTALLMHPRYFLTRDVLCFFMKSRRAKKTYYNI